VLCLYFKQAALPCNQETKTTMIEVVSFDFCQMPAAVPPLLPHQETFPAPWYLVCCSARGQENYNLPMQQWC